MASLDDGLLTARPVDPCDNDGDDGSVDSVIAIHALYGAPRPQSPPLEGTGGAGRARIRSGGTGSEGAGGTVRRLIGILFLLVAAGCAVARWCHHDHGSYLPQRTGSGQPHTSIEIESMDAGPALKAENEAAEPTAATTASPTASPTSSSTTAATASPTASPSTEATATASPLDTALDMALDTADREAIAALERQVAELELRTAEDDPRHKAALLEELLSHHRRADDHAAAADVEQRLRGLGAATFAVGDVVEQLYNANTLKCRILYPFRVEEVHFGGRDEPSREPNDGDLDDEPSVHGPRPEGEADDDAALAGTRYTIVRLSDGRVVERVPESFLRPYVPYGPETRALCNVGGAAIGEERLFSCSILEFILPGDKHAQLAEKSATEGGDGEDGRQHTLPPTQHVRIKRHGEEMLRSRYRVAIHGGEAEGEAIIAMDRMQRRP